MAGLRFFNVNEPGENHKTEMHSPMFQFSVKTSRGEPIQVFGPEFDGAEEPRRDFVHASDAVAMLLWAWQTRQHDLYNVGTGEAYSFGEIDQTAVETMGHGWIETIAFPSQMADAYQRRTKASLKRIYDAVKAKHFVRSVRVFQVAFYGFRLKSHTSTTRFRRGDLLTAKKLHMIGMIPANHGTTSS